MAKAPKATETKTPGKRGRPLKVNTDTAEVAVKPEKKTPKIYNSAVNDEEKALFLRYLPTVRGYRAKIASLTGELRAFYKTAKSDGIDKADFDYAFAIEDAEKEARARAKIARQLTIAKFVGSDLGAQLDMFLEPSRVPAEDRAAEEGQRDSMEGKTANPKYDPSTPQAAAYLQAYHDDQEKRIKNGIKPLEVPADDDAEWEAAAPDTTLITAAEKEARATALADARAREAAANAPVPSSGTPMTRSQFMAAQRASKSEAKENAEALFTKKSIG